jgi:hypothetical protein
MSHADLKNNFKSPACELFQQSWCHNVRHLCVLLSADCSVKKRFGKLTLLSKECELRLQQRNHLVFSCDYKSMPMDRKTGLRRAYLYLKVIVVEDFLTSTGHHVQQL